jgi:hypothetical protein
MSAIERQLLLGNRNTQQGSRRNRLQEDVDITPALLAKARRAQPHFQRSIASSSFRSRIRQWLTCREGSVAIFLVLAILLLLCLTILGGLLMRPWFTAGLLAAFGAGLLFVLTESAAIGAWHRSREAENRFWICVAIVLSTTLVFAPDSPLSAIGSMFPAFGCLFVFICAAAAHYYDRLLEREELGRAPHLRRVSSFILTNQESTKQKLQVVQDALAALDYRFVAAKAVNQTQILEAERDIVRTLQECEREELNYILTNVNLSLLFVSFCAASHRFCATSVLTIAVAVCSSVQDQRY